MLVSRLPALFRSYGSSFRSWSIVYRLKVYELLALLPPHTYQGDTALLTPCFILSSVQLSLLSSCLLFRSQPFLYYLNFPLIKVFYFSSLPFFHSHPFLHPCVSPFLPFVVSRRNQACIQAHEGHKNYWVPLWVTATKSLQNSLSCCIIYSLWIQSSQGWSFYFHQTMWDPFIPNTPPPPLTADFQSVPLNFSEQCLKVNTKTFNTVQLMFYDDLHII